MYNTHRAVCYTKKGKEIGYPIEWQSYLSFRDIMSDGFFEGAVLVRIDKNQPYSKENCQWMEKGSESLSNLSVLTYNGVTKTILEWCAELGLNYNGVRQRKFRGRNYTPEEILFGKKAGINRPCVDFSELSYAQRRAKASKMVSAYKCRDIKRGRLDENNIPLNYVDIDYIVTHIFGSSCTYCGDNKRVGCDRIDNTKSHTKDNCVPCCRGCNTTRNNVYTHEEMKLLGETISKIKRIRDNDDNKG
jgi:hypothetical protein